MDIASISYPLSFKRYAVTEESTPPAHPDNNFCICTIYQIDLVPGKIYNI